MSSTQKQTFYDKQISILNFRTPKFDFKIDTENFLFGPSYKNTVMLFKNKNSTAAHVKPRDLKNILYYAYNNYKNGKTSFRGR